MRRAWLAAVLVIAAVAAMTTGCGEEEETAEAGPVSKAEFIERATSICEKERVGLGDRVSAYLAEHRDDGKPREVLYADLVHAVVLTTVEGELWQLEALEAPPQDRDEVYKMVTGERIALDIIATQPRISSIPAARRKFAESGAMFRAYGLPGCANDRLTAAGEAGT